MTLKRARVSLGATVAGTAGVGMVALTRVGHPWHLMLETDLPPYEAFMAARVKPEFRSRQRYKLRLRAKASRTIRKYGCYERDVWDRRESELADGLLRRVQQETDRERRSTGTAADPDAWVWRDHSEAPVLHVLARAVDSAVRDGVDEGDALRVAERLQSRWHMPALLEAAGCLIPRDLHPSMDGVKPKGNATPGGTVGGVSVQAGGWGVQVGDERSISLDGQPLTKGVFEFGLIVLRDVCSMLSLEVAVGSLGLGSLLNAAESDTDAALRASRFVTWTEAGGLRDKFLAAKKVWLAIPTGVGKQVRDCLAVSVRADDEGKALADAEGLVCEVYHRLQHVGRAKQLAGRLEALLPRPSTVRRGRKVQLHMQEGLPDGENVGDAACVALGLAVGFVAGAAGCSSPSVAESGFAQGMRQRLSACFQYLREEAYRRGVRDAVVASRRDEEVGRGKQAVKFFRGLLELLAGSGAAAVPVRRDADLSARAMREVSAKGVGMQATHVVTWNIAGSDKAEAAPEKFSVFDKWAWLRSTLERWSHVDILALQESPQASQLAGLAATFRLLGSCQSHRAGHYVQLYVRVGVEAGPGRRVSGCNAVAAWVKFDAARVLVVSVHLAPHAGGAKTRLRQMVALSKFVNAELEKRRGVADAEVGGQDDAVAALVLGDMNVRGEEMPELLETGDWSEAKYQGKSWNPMVNRFYAQEPDCRPEGHSFDRVLYTGCVNAVSFLAGTGRRWADGRAFALSDHFAVYGLVDLHSCHSSSGAKSVREQRRVDLGKQRDACAVAEKEVVTLEERILRDADWESQQRASLEEREAHLRAWRKAVKERRERKLRLREAVQGSESLFASSLDDVFGKLVSMQPLAHAESVVPAFDGLLCLGGDVAWAEVRGGRPSAKVYRSGVAAIDFAVQCLHRLLPLALWLDRHAELCSDSQKESVECIICALHRCKQDFGKNLSQTLLLPRFSLGFTVQSGNYERRDPVEYLVRLLEQLRAREVELGHVCEPAQRQGADVVCHLDRLFRFWVEKRSECLTCGRKAIAFEANWFWRVSAGGFEAAEATVQELYLRSCAAVEAPSMCRGCRTVQPHREQKRLATLPNALIVFVDREGSSGVSMESLAVLAEDHLAFPALGPNLELVSVLFRSNRCLCACRCGDGDFWWFDAGRACQCLGQSVCGVMKNKVSVLLYQRPSGEAEFSGGRCEASRTSRAPQTFGAAGSGADRRNVLPRAQGAVESRPESKPYTSVQDLLAARRAKEQANRMEAAIAQAEHARRSRKDGLDKLARALGATAGGVSQARQQTGAVSGKATESSQREQWRRETASVVSQQKEARARGGGEAGKGEGHGNVRLDAAARLDAGSSGKRSLLRRYKGGQKTDVLTSSSAAASAAVASAAAVASGAAHLRGSAADSGSVSGRGYGGAGSSSGEVGRAKSGHAVVTDAPVEFYPMENTLIYLELEQLCVPTGIIEGVLVLMQREFTPRVAYKLAQEVWLRDWARWSVFAVDVQAALGDCPVDDQPEVHVQESRGLLRSLMFDVFQRVAADRDTSQAASNLMRMTDREKVAALRLQGWVCGKASGVGSNCLIDSLLQLLVSFGIVVMPPDRAGACEAVRKELISTPGLEPQEFDTGLVSPRAYLEHFRHAGAVVRSLVVQYGALDRLPADGVRVVVHARYDRLGGPDDQLRACVGLSDRPGEALRLNLFCLTGDGFAGYHYEPLFWRSPQVVGGEVVESVDLVDDGDEGGEEEDEGGNDEKEAADVASAKLLSLQTAAEEDLAVAVGRSTEELARREGGAAVTSTGAERRAVESEAAQQGKRIRTRELRRQNAMAGIEGGGEEIDGLRRSAFRQGMVDSRGREVRRRVGQQLDTTRPLRRSLANVGDDELELSMNLDRLDLGDIDEAMAPSAQGSLSMGSSSARAVISSVDGALREPDLVQRREEPVRPIDSAGAMGSNEGLASVGTGRLDAVSAQRVGVAVVRRSGVAGMEEILSENQHVAREMERRDFQLREGQWVGGVLLPGDPSDDADLESFLRSQFQSEESEARSRAWGPGRALGRK